MEIVARSRSVEKIVEREAIAKFLVTPVDAKWIDTKKAFEEEPMQIRSLIVVDFQSGARPGLYAGTLPLEALKAERITSKHSQSCTSTCHMRMFTQRLTSLVLVRLPAEDKLVVDAGKFVW